MKKKNAIMAVLLLTMSYQANAEVLQDTLVINLQQAIDIALSENPTIKVADKEIALKKVANTETWQNLLPQASIGTRLDHTIQAAEMKLNGMKFKMGEDGTNSVNTTLNISLPLFAPSVYKAMKMTKTDIALSMEKARGTKQDLINQVTKAYYQLLLAQDSYEVIKASYKVAEDNYNIVSAKFDQGKVSEFDKISAEVQLRSVRPNMVAAQNAISLSSLQLRVLLGLMDHEVKLNDNLAFYEKMVDSNTDVVTVADFRQNTTLRQLEMNKDLLEKNIKMQRMSFLPTLGLSFSYQYQSIYNDNINIFGYDWAGSSTLLFNLNIPLYQAKNFTKMKTAKLQLQQLEWNRRDVERKIEMQAQSYRNSMTASSEQVESNRKNVEQAEKAVMIATKRYEVGKGTVLELNSSQVSLTQAELVYRQSIFDYLVAKADLEKVMGKQQ